jgi:catechol 2,3-dioxygenase-like lactoylglutathione lyase family enzyme
VIWGVPTPADLEAFVSNLAQDREVRRDDDGTAHFLSDFGLAMGLRVFARKPLVTQPDEVNSPGNIRRINRSRRWRKRAAPKVIQHVVFRVQDASVARKFMCSRLNFRLSELVSPSSNTKLSERHNLVAFLRASGSNNHHNIAVLDDQKASEEFGDKIHFHHVNFGVDDLDELMVGVNHMLQKGWRPSEVGLGRHRIASSLFYYFPSPTGGEVEYGADHDFLDDSWIPRIWREPLFAGFIFAHNLPPFLKTPPPWRVDYLDDEDPGNA